MESKAKAFGHPIHPMLVVFPLGLFVASLVFDIIRLAGASDGFSIAAFYAIAGGVIGGLAAAIFGLMDWVAIPPGTRAKRVGAIHGLGNVIVTALFVISWALRAGNPTRRPGGAFVLSLIAVLLALITGWLGGELVERLGVGVAPGAHADAPSSLSGRPASERWAEPRPLEPRRT